MKKHFFNQLLKLLVVTITFIIIALFIIGPLPFYLTISNYDFYFNNPYIESKSSYLFFFLTVLFKDIFITLPLIALINTRKIGILISLIIGFFIGLEKFLYYIQGESASFNSGMSTFMAENFLKSILNPDQIVGNSSLYFNDPFFYIYIVCTPIIFTIFLLTLFKLVNLKPFKLEFALLNLFAYLVLVTNAYTLNMPYYHRVINSFSIILSEYYNNALLNIQREKPFIEQTEKPKIKNIVLIVGESVRPDYISLNNKIPYIYKATEKLSELENNGHLINYGQINSIGNCSHVSNKFLLTGLPKNKERFFETNPTFFQYLKNAGYKTHQIDSPHNGYFNGRKSYDNDYIDTYDSVVKTEKHYRDIESLKYMDKYLSNTNDFNFIYSVQQGVHFPAENSYPKESAIYHEKSTEINTPHDELLYLSDYLNGLHWSVNEFWRELEIMAKKHPDTIFIYTGDHGANILPKIDNRKSITISHCVANFSDFSNLYTVPLFIYSENKDLLKLFKEHKENLSHKQILPTLLYLAGYKESDIKNIYGSTINDSSENKLFFKMGTKDLLPYSEVETFLNSPTFNDSRRDLNKNILKDLNQEDLINKYFSN